MMLNYRFDLRSALELLDFRKSNIKLSKGIVKQLYLVQSCIGIKNTS